MRFQIVCAVLLSLSMEASAMRDIPLTSALVEEKIVWLDRFDLEFPADVVENSRLVELHSQQSYSTEHGYGYVPMDTEIAFFTFAAGDEVLGVVVYPPALKELVITKRHLALSQLIVAAISNTEFSLSWITQEKFDALLVAEEIGDFSAEFNAAVEEVGFIKATERVISMKSYASGVNSVLTLLQDY
ncbi:hypothetical protein [Vibrio barjaei]|uniref:hypothetical protein n=1 Tax=Vibrio barjaei TaxID=1676683 RepID=UPI002284808D|nr:hypothetical protein [Vibrio barjaei]MCY9870418.1 hypothetical protein [Vibrio barjaei]